MQEKQIPRHVRDDELKKRNRLAQEPAPSLGLEGDILVGDFWTGGTGGESVVGVAGLIVFFGMTARTGASGHAAAFATSA